MEILSYIVSNITNIAVLFALLGVAYKYFNMKTREEKRLEYENFNFLYSIKEIGGKNYIIKAIDHVLQELKAGQIAASLHFVSLLAMTPDIALSLRGRFAEPDAAI